MIDYIKGTLAEVTPAYAVVDCGGVGYGANISLSTYTQIKDQQTVKLLIYEAIREDAYVLFGFAQADEREFFKLLISVSGVGANTARMILSAYPVSELRRAITLEDANTLKGIKGIGLKTAQRIIVELKDKMDKLDLVETGELFATTADNKVREEALSALEVLGFNKGASAKVVDKLLKETPDAEVAVVVKMAIKML